MPSKFRVKEKINTQPQTDSKKEAALKEKEKRTRTL